MACWVPSMQRWWIDRLAWSSSELRQGEGQDQGQFQRPYSFLARLETVSPGKACAPCHPLPHSGGSYGITYLPHSVHQKGCFYLRRALTLPHSVIWNHLSAQCKMNSLITFVLSIWLFSESEFRQWISPCFWWRIHIHLIGFKFNFTGFWFYVTSNICNVPRQRFENKNVKSSRYHISQLNVVSQLSNLNVVHIVPFCSS